MTFGSGEYTYRADMDWAKRPEGWTWGWTPGMACDSQGRIFVSSRCDHPLVLFDADGNFLDSWGEGILDTAAAHGIYIDPDDNVYCTEFNRHCIRKFNPDGALVLTIGTPGVPGEQDGVKIEGLRRADQGADIARVGDAVADEQAAAYFKRR